MSKRRSVRMPHDNRMSSSEALKTNDIWTKTIGHDPYASDKLPKKTVVDAATEEQHQGLLLMARLNSVKNGMQYIYMDKHLFAVLICKSLCNACITIILLHTFVLHAFRCGATRRLFSLRFIRTLDVPV